MLADRDEPVIVEDLPPGDPRWTEAFVVLRQLRPHLDRAAFDALAQSGARQGLRFTAAFGADGRCLGVAGWRIVDNTSVVRKLYVDDLVVDAEARSLGVGASLLRHLEDEGRRAGARTIELDSGHQRQDAHRFYRREGYTDRAAHFAKTLEADG